MKSEKLSDYNYLMGYTCTIHEMCWSPCSLCVNYKAYREIFRAVYTVKCGLNIIAILKLGDKSYKKHLGFKKVRDKKVIHIGSANDIILRIMESKQYNRSISFWKWAEILYQRTKVQNQ